MKTGRDADRSGWYLSECCHQEVTLLKGQMCPRCPTCHELTVWVFIKETRQLSATGTASTSFQMAE
jgi:hypothetical protein